MNDDIIINNGPVNPGPWKILTIIFGLTTAVAAIVAGYFFIANNNANTELSKLKKEAGTAAIETTPLASLKTLGFDNTNVTNPVDNATYSLRYEDPLDLFSDLSLSANGESLAVRLNTANVMNVYGASPAAEATLTFTARVVDIYLYMAGQAAGDEILLFLMEDGSVEYMPMAKAVAAGELKSYGTVKDLKNVTKFYRASVAVSAPEGSESAGGYVTTLAQSINGTIYDLQPIFESILSPEAPETQQEDVPADNCSPNSGTNCINNQPEEGQ